MEDIDPPEYFWPDIQRKAFTAKADPSLNACVGWVLTNPYDVFGYIEGYRKAACILYEKVIETGMSPDYLFFPYVFQWRHHLELAITLGLFSMHQQLPNSCCRNNYALDVAGLAGATLRRRS